MMSRQYLLDARAEMGLTQKAAAHRLRISLYLYMMLERDDAWITHPNIARRIKRLYGLTDAQYETMMHQKHWRRKGRSAK